MLQEMILGLLCLVALLILMWDFTLQLKLKRLDKKIKALEEKKTLQRKQKKEIII